MVIRLLVAVLTLVGPMPFRVCTCAASAPAQSPADKHSPAPPAKVKKCRCADCGPASGTAAPAHSDPIKCEAEPPSTPHDSDCPAVNPRVFVRDAGTPPTTDVPVDHGTACAVITIESLPFTRVPTAAPDRPHAPRIPLYLAFLSLRN